MRINGPVIMAVLVFSLLLLNCGIAWQAWEQTGLSTAVSVFGLLTILSTFFLLLTKAFLKKLDD